MKVSKEKKEYYETFSDAGLRGNHTIIVNLILWGGLGLICLGLSSDKAALANKYTVMHARMNEGFFFSIAGFLIMKGGMTTLYSWGKFDNKCLRWICEPFLMLFRVAAVAAYAYYIVWQRTLYGWFGGCYFALYNNWWALKTDPWITNASYFNAFWSWPVWVLGWIFMAVVSFYSVAGIFFIFYLIITIAFNAGGLRRGSW